MVNIKWGNINALTKVKTTMPIPKGRLDTGRFQTNEEVLIPPHQNLENLPH